MALDGLVVRAIANELQACVGGRIHKIHQPSPHDIVLQIRSRGVSRKVLISASPTYPRVHATERTFVNPLEAPMFCMLLRKHFENAVIESIRQEGAERVLHLDVRQSDELGDINAKRLIIELMGRHSNIIITDPSTGTIVDGIHHVTPAISSYRVVMPGTLYTNPPAQDKADPFQETELQCLERMLQANDEEQAMKASAWLVHTYSGISPLAAREVVHRSGHSIHTDMRTFVQEPASGQKLAHSFLQTVRLVAENHIEPNITADEQADKSYFSAIALSHVDGTAVRFPSISDCLDTYFGEKAERDLVKQKTADLERFLLNEIAKNAKKIDKLKEAAADAEQAERYRIMGELITANLYQMERGMEHMDVINYYDEQQAPITIPLDPQLTPSENAQRYFKRYTKAKNGRIAAREQLESASAEIKYLESVLVQLRNASLQDIEEIRDELAEEGYVRQRNKKEKRKKKNNKPAVSGYLSSEGIPLYVGKNNLQNEYVTNRMAHSSDTWLHTKDIPGSHVVIRSREYGDATLEEAAMLAAYFSQARESSQVPVDYTLIRHVRKPNGAKPGYVIYDNQKTVYVTPDKERIDKLKPLNS
ncbi:fibronectin/fibrinogen-binding protein [Xylanibacillus composti]|uniref:Rqc2 homolog RqcH n=1 Tax=Xylanibacillus composti TaxID=1572762 RepID=A0A8J4GYR2_9BACL|nr:NFACT RNA binding domain-containing protein [Xylanibacillus composti]MDT9725585.1 fibronectin/fibrinogen-binding protein [Xylanibacillus composti]GIQ67678.1 hypothetical protein XYCOK13_05020 [Xylanibacillus composti]